MPLIPVRVRDCACPHTPHADEGDLVYLLPTLPMDGGILAEQQLLAHTAAGDGDGLTRAWVRTFTEHGAVGWNLTDEDGDVVPFDLGVLTADWGLVRPVADKAAELYADSVTSPFETKPSARSPSGPTPPTTSRRRTPTPSSPSSP